jgi:ankyrin repeat protein
MARKKASKKQAAPDRLQSQLVPHRAPDLSELLDRASDGNSLQALQAFLSAGCSPTALVEVPYLGQGELRELLPAMIRYTQHPHDQLAECVELLVREGADVDAISTAPGAKARTSLMWSACEACCTIPMQILLSNGSDPFKQSLDTGVTALHMAAGSGSVEQCQLLIDVTNGSTVNLADNNGCTPVWYAVELGRSAPVLELLHKYNAELDVVVPSIGSTPLLVAAGRADVPVMRFLLQHGVNVHATVQHSRKTVLLAAVCTGSVEAVQLLLDHGANAAAQDSDGHNPLYTAAVHGHVPVLQLLAQRCGLDVHIVDVVGDTLLMAAAACGRTAAVEWLLQHNLAVNATARQRYTALHMAAARGHADVVALLAAHGADVHQRTAHNRTALDLAAE